VNLSIIDLPAAILVECSETSISLPKNLVGPSTIDLVVPPMREIPLGKNFEQVLHWFRKPLLKLLGQCAAVSTNLLVNYIIIMCFFNVHYYSCRLRYSNRAVIIVIMNHTSGS